MWAPCEGPCGRWPALGPGHVHVPALSWACSVQTAQRSEVWEAHFHRLAWKGRASRGRAASKNPAREGHPDVGPAGVGVGGVTRSRERQQQRTKWGHPAPGAARHPQVSEVTGAPRPQTQHCPGALPGPPCTSSPRRAPAGHRKPRSSTSVRSPSTHATPSVPTVSEINNLKMYSITVF